MEASAFEALCKESLPAAYEVARKLGQGRGKPHARSSEQVWRYTKPHFLGEIREVFLVLALDARHRVLRDIQVSVGTVNSTLIHPREVFRELLLTPGCAAFVAVHNHPSGDPSPSTEDEEVTRRLRKAGKLLGITLLDHIVSGHTSWASLRKHMSWEES